MLGKLLGSAVRVVNAPMDAAERTLGRDGDSDRLMSAPLEHLAESLDDADKGFKEKDQ